MTAALPPSRGIGIAGTTLAHAVLVVGALFAARGSHLRPQITYEVNLVAAPARTNGTATATAPPQKEIAPAPKQKVVKAPPKKVPLQARPSEATKTKPQTQTAPVPGEKPSTGTDVVSVRQEGNEFPDKAYLANIENSIFARWQHEVYRPGLNVKIEFVINRDGTVDTKSVRVTKASGNSSFDQAALAAIELSSTSRAFGALPGTWSGASLPIVFDFTQLARVPQ